MHYLAWVLAQDRSSLAATLDPYNLNKHMTALCVACKPRERCDPPCLHNPNGRWDGWTIGGRWHDVFGGNVLVPDQCLEGLEHGFPETDLRGPYSFVDGDGWMNQERWCGPETGYVREPSFRPRLIEALTAAASSASVFVVDYHR